MSFAHPIWLILIALLPFIGIAAVILAGSRAKGWKSMVAERLRPSLILSINPIPRWIGLIFLLAATACILAGLARPQGDGGTGQETTTGRNLLIALDLSRSMRSPDIKPDRLSAAKLIIYELLDAMPEERIGLIGFAGNAYLYAPLTIDHHAVRETVEQMDENWPTIGGSDLCSATKLGIETLRQTGQKNNALVIISDGERHGGDLQAVIDAANRNGVFILTIGVGTDDGDYIPHPDFPGERMVNRDGTPVISRLQADTLRELANRTDGTYASANSGANLPAIVQSAISNLETFEVKGKERKLMIEFYQWFTLPAILFLIASMILNTRWRPILSASAVLLAAMLLAPAARGDDAENAARAMADQDFQRARILYQDLAKHARGNDRRAAYRYAEATAAYRSNAFNEARAAYSKALLGKQPELLANAHLGTGNCLFQLGWLELTGEAYPQNADSLPDFDRFDKIASAYIDKLRNKSEGPTYPQLEGIITNWADAIRHYDSALSHMPSLAQAGHNRKLTVAYLERLLKDLNDKERETEQMIPPPTPSDPKQGDDPENPENQDDPKNPGDQDPNSNPQNPENPDGNQGDPTQDPKQPGDQQQEPKDPQQDPKQGNDDAKNDRNNPLRPGETPEQRARRILRENADCEKGPLSPGYREFTNPAKDW